MKIAIITSNFLPRIGGLEMFVHDLASQFIHKGHTVLVISQRYPRHLKKRETIGTVAVERILFFNPPLVHKSAANIAAYIYTLLSAPLNCARFFFRMKRFAPDVVNLHFAGSPSFFLLLFCALNPVPLVVSLHGEDVRVLPHQSRIGRVIFKKLLCRADTITVTSAHVLKQVRDLEPSMHQKMRVVQNGINVHECVEAPSGGQAAQFILAAGRLVHKKGFDILLEAFARLPQAFSDVQRILVGEGPEEGDLRARIKQLRLEHRVVMWGRASRSDVYSLMSGCRLFVVPSRDEPFGLVVLEAMACAKPIVASKSGGPEEILTHEVNGLLVEKESPEELAKAIGRLLEDAPLAARLSDNAGRSVLDFDISRVADAYLAIFGSVNKKVRA